MKIYMCLVGISLIGCSVMVQKKEINWESLAMLNGHTYFEDEHLETSSNRYPSQVTKEMKESDKCSDQTNEEIDNLDAFIIKFDGKINNPKHYEHSLSGFQNFIEDSGLTKYFTAKEMVSPNSMATAKSCGYKLLLPSRCRWKSAVAQGLLAVELRKEINKNRKVEKGIKIRNWWRPTCYNQKVGGAKSSDHMQARGFDLDFKSANDRAVAQAYLCKMYKESSPLSLQVGIGCQTLHIGIGSPKRLSRYPDDGARFWKYGSLQRCSLKRIDTDDCWKLGSDSKLHIYAEEGSGIL